MIKKIIFWVTVVSALAAAVIIALVAAAFALYAAVAPSLGPPWAAAIVAGVAAGLVAASALIHSLRGAGSRRHPEPEPSLVDRLTTIAREKPVLAAGAALAAGLVALKNPRLAAGLASAFMAGKAADKVDHPRKR